MLLTKEDFNEKVIDAPGIAFVEFYADWCPHCKAYAPEYRQIAEDLAPQAAFYQVEIDSSPELTSEYGVNSVPTILVFNNGDVVNTFLGAQNESIFVQEIEKLQ